MRSPLNPDPGPCQLESRRYRTPTHGVLIECRLLCKHLPAIVAREATRWHGSPPDERLVVVPQTHLGLDLERGSEGEVTRFSTLASVSVRLAVGRRRRGRRFLGGRGNGRGRRYHHGVVVGVREKGEGRESMYGREGYGGRVGSTRRSKREKGRVVREGTDSRGLLCLNRSPPFLSKGPSCVS